jgi:hypothetical protein
MCESVALLLMVQLYLRLARIVYQNPIFKEVCGSIATFSKATQVIFQSWGGSSLTTALAIGIIHGSRLEHQRGP